MPSDIFFHFIVGAAIFAFVPRMEIVMAAALFKEAVIDMTANMNNQAVLEPLKDIGFTMMGAFFVFMAAVIIRQAVSR